MAKTHIVVMKDGKRIRVKDVNEVIFYKGDEVISFYDDNDEYIASFKDWEYTFVATANIEVMEREV